MTTKTYTLICLSILLLIGLRLGYVAYQHRPLDAYRLQSDVTVDESSYAVGDTISWSFTVCKLHDEDFYSQRSLENLDNGKVYVIPEILTKGKLSKGQCQAVHPSTKIPTNLDIPAGNYHLCSQTIVPDVNKSIRPFKYCTNQFTIRPE